MADQQTELDHDDLVRVGTVARAHGIKGEVKVLSDFGGPEDFLAVKEIWLADPGMEPGKEIKVTRSRPGGKFVILQIKGVADRTSAENLCGKEVWIDRQFLPELPDGQYHWHELIGLQVETEGGRRLGEVTTLFATAGHDILVIRGGGREYLLPVREEFLLDRNSETGILTVADVPGLFEIND